MRGEQYYLLPPVGYDEGSPPHARGAVVHYEPLPLVRGITPACAGSSGIEINFSKASWDHPRMRGEQTIATHRKSVTTGSPPHARGAVHRPRCERGTLGITPACAGSSVPSVKPIRSTRDHPRIRGEQSIERPGRQMDLGSPPHTRGAGSINTKECFHRGITPAYAGSSARKEERRDTW